MSGTNRAPRLVRGRKKGAEFTQAGPPMQRHPPRKPGRDSPRPQTAAQGSASTSTSSPLHPRNRNWRDSQARRTALHTHLQTLPDVRAAERPPYNECMQSESPLDTLISAADRALRSVFAPAKATRPMPLPPPVLPATPQPGSVSDDLATGAGAHREPSAPRANPTSAHSTASTAPGARDTSAAGANPLSAHPTAGAAPSARDTSATTAGANPTSAHPTAGTAPSTRDSSTTGQAAPSSSASEAPSASAASASTATNSAAGNATETSAPRRPGDLTDAEKRTAAALMRVNHAGEIAAQALYHGQALMARSTATRELLLKAAREETDHLAWCETRLRDLDSRPSLLNPLWYAGSFAIGAAAALLGDRISLGFVVETERQVEGHLDEHLARLPPGDARSRAILQTMQADEIAHGMSAKAAGGAELPAPVRALMRSTALVMTRTAYWI